MEVRSLAYRTDLIFPTFDGEIFDRGNYLVIRTPSNPTFYWGNFLLFDQPPSKGDYSRWQEKFVEEIAKRYPDRMIIFDSPPVLMSSIPGVLALHSAQIVFVVRSEKTTQTSIDTALGLVSERLSGHAAAVRAAAATSACRRVITPSDFGFMAAPGG